MGRVVVHKGPTEGPHEPNAEVVVVLTGGVPEASCNPRVFNGVEPAAAATDGEVRVVAFTGRSEGNYFCADA